MSRFEIIEHVPDPDAKLIFEDRADTVTRDLADFLNPSIEPRVRIVDPAIAPDRQRLVPLADGWPDLPPGVVEAARLKRRVDNTPHGRMRGKRAMEMFATPSLRSGTTLMAEGRAAHLYHKKRELEHDHDYIMAETVCLIFPNILTLKTEAYYLDVEEIVGGRMARAIEIKRDERDLRDPMKRFKYALVAEIFRRIDVEFKFVLLRDMFKSRQHRVNVEEVFDCRFVEPHFGHYERLARLAARSAQTTFGEVTEALEPARPINGRAMAFSMIVRGHVRLDLAQRLLPSTPVDIHPFDPGDAR